MSTRRVGWFADIDPDQSDSSHQWQPCLETGTGIVPSLSIWFASEAECESYIRSEIVPIAGTMLL